MDGPKQLDEETLQDLYAWIDKIPLSRPKRNITRDFSDGGNVNEFILVTNKTTCYLALYVC